MNNGQMGWVSFGEYFRATQFNGIADSIAARALLSALSDLASPMKARGSRRQWERGTDMPERERLPREAEPRFVPASFWRLFDSIGPNGDSQWQDLVEPDDAFSVTWARVDWVSGDADWQDWVPDSDWVLMLTKWRGLEIPQETVNQLLTELCGFERKQADASRSPSDAEVHHFMKSAIESGMRQRAAIKAWQELHPGRGTRDGLADFYNSAHLELKGEMPSRGRPKKFPE